MTAITQAPARFARLAVEVLRQIGRDYSAKRVSMVAAALAWYVFLSLFPFTLVLLAAVGYVVGASEPSLSIVRQLISRALPGSDLEIERQLRDIAANRALVGGLGLVALAWSASGAFAVWARALRIIWEVETAPTFVRARGRALLLLLLAVVFLLVSVAVTSAASLLAQLSAAGVLPLLGELRLMFRVAGLVLPLGISFVMFLALYRIIPVPGLAPRHLAAAAGFAAPAWELAKRGFTYYLENFASFDRVYGPVGAVVVLMLWIYISAIIALVGAQLAWVYAQRRPA